MEKIKIKEVLLLVKDKESGEIKKVTTDVYFDNVQNYELLDF